eukprot:scaffold753_cov320-Prasinococcus_capsulatus_cf.AAC.1
MPRGTRRGPPRRGEGPVASGASRDMEAEVVAAAARSALDGTRVSRRLRQVKCRGGTGDSGKRGESERRLRARRLRLVGGVAATVSSTARRRTPTHVSASQRDQTSACTAPLPFPEARHLAPTQTGGGGQPSAAGRTVRRG